MKRRTFLKSVIGLVVAPCLPQVKTEPKPAKKIEYRKYARLEVPTIPLIEGKEPIGWKMWCTSRILNDDFIHILKVTA